MRFWMSLCLSMCTHSHTKSSCCVGFPFVHTYSRADFKNFKKAPQTPLVSHYRIGSSCRDPLRPPLVLALPLHLFLRCHRHGRLAPALLCRLSAIFMLPRNVTYFEGALEDLSITCDGRWDQITAHIKNVDA